MMKFGVCSTAAVLLSGCATTDAPLPQSVAIISEAQAESQQCEFVDVVSAMRFAITAGPSATSRQALIAALEDAEQRGANAAVIASQTADNNQQSVNLRAYRCP